MSIKTEASPILLSGLAVASAFVLVGGLGHHAAPVDATAPGGRIQNHWIAYPHVHNGPGVHAIGHGPKIRVVKH